PPPPSGNGFLSKPIRRRSTELSPSGISMPALLRSASIGCYAYREGCAVNTNDIMAMRVPLQIVSGGQTGADRAALDWAIDHGVAHGGWCPKERKAEDGTIPGHYSLRETP